MWKRTTATRLIRAFALPAALSVFCALPRLAAAQEPPPFETEPEGLVAEPEVVHRAALFAGRHFTGGERRAGIYADFVNMIPGAGWIAGGPGYRWWSANDRILLEASAALSWRGYRSLQARAELARLARSRLALGTQIRWQDFPQVNAFGEGPQSLESNRSQYGLRSTNIVGYATLRPLRWLEVDGTLGWLTPSVRPPGGRFKSSRPYLRDVFPADPVFALSDRPAFAHTEISVTADTRDHPGHPARGGIVHAGVSRYSDRDNGVFSFTRYEAEAARFVPLRGSRVVIALRGWIVGSGTDDGGTVPFYLQPSLGGGNTLRSYADYRFHDRNLLVINAEARVALMTHVDAAVFVDAGNVAARISDLNLDKRSYGAGLRLHARRHTFGRLDLARGGEGWRLVLRLSDPLDLFRLSRRTAAVPFVP